MCGNGHVEPGETCDDANTTSGDGCSAACQLEFSCPPGQVTFIQTSTDGPLLIPDAAGPPGAQSVIQLADSYVVSRAVVVVNAISHTRLSDVGISLITPAATTVTLVSGNGGDADEYVSTIFDPAAPTAITAGTAPYRGRYQPQGPLGNVHGQSSKGAWTLRVTDSTTPWGGVLKSWTIAMCGN
ncbi:hypothetical protein GF068_39375 [Polyangium spumosum]|uniref:P/Homo B domain-containing protein n=1 Tax=Polyangium spumosum TaxID=889282 RepID=A0A6N7Q0E7_9BACT|nr:hypothetical protein [Polyangium spumosum]